MLTRCRHSTHAWKSRDNGVAAGSVGVTLRSEPLTLRSNNTLRAAGLFPLVILTWLGVSI